MKSIKFFIIEVVLLIPIILLTVVARFISKKVDVGLGPDPLINNLYHKKALELFGYSVETFVNGVYHIASDFDIRFDTKLNFLPRYLRIYFMYLFVIFRYKILYIYFNGGPLGFYTTFLWRLEPYLYKIANVKVVLMPYGSDVQDFRKYQDLLFKNATIKDYPIHVRNYLPKIEKKVNNWCQLGDHIISGCDWSYHLHYWDTLMISHFSIDIKNIEKYNVNSIKTDKFKIVHAPNHRNIKGTQFIIDAINELVEEGYNIELILLEKLPNSVVKEKIAESDLVIDQLIVGWYAMFAIEAMCLKKPVITKIDKKLEELYIMENLLKKDELPLINADIYNIKDIIITCYKEKDILYKIGEKSYNYVCKHHSLESIGSTFDRINQGVLK